MTTGERDDAGHCIIALQTHTHAKHCTIALKLHHHPQKGIDHLDGIIARVPLDILEPAIGHPVALVLLVVLVGLKGRVACVVQFQPEREKDKK